MHGTPNRMVSWLRPPAERTAFVSALFGLSLACGGPAAMDAGANGPLDGSPPDPTAIEGAVRTITLRAYAGLSSANDPAVCTLEAWLFDTSAPMRRTVMATDGECTLYAAAPVVDVTSQSWICAGAISTRYAGMQENLVICPAAGGTLRPSVPIPCTSLAAGTDVQFTSGNELPPGDVLTDLAATIRMPGTVSITQPTSLGVTSWPATGALDVRWSSVDATSALVLVEAQNPAAPTPTIVCRPATNGQVTVASSLIFQGNLRLQTCDVRVQSYRGVVVTAEAGRTYRLWAGHESKVVLQPR